MPGNIRYQLSLQERTLGGLMAGPAITGSGGVVMACKPGTAQKASLFDANGVAVANPFPLTRGGATFFVTNAQGLLGLDLYVQAPDGQQLQEYATFGDSLLDLPVDRHNRRQLMMVPFSLADSVAATEKDSGMILPAKAIIQVDVGIEVITLEAAKTLNVGTLSSQAGGSATAFITGLSVAAAGLKLAQSLATKTRGGKFADGAAGSPDMGYAVDANPAAVNVSYTLSAGTTVAEGIILLPFLLPTRAMPKLALS